MAQPGETKAKARGKKSEKQHHQMLYTRDSMQLWLSYERIHAHPTTAASEQWE